MFEKMISKKVEHFAFPFGNLSSVSSGALQLARENNKYVCSGLRGSNYEIPTESVLRYETLHPWDPMVIESAVLNSTGDPRCRDALSVLDYWCQDILVEVKL